MARSVARIKLDGGQKKVTEETLMKQKYGRLSIFVCLSVSHRRKHAGLTERTFRTARLRYSDRSAHSLRSLSHDRSTASTKASSPHSAI
jgi:hypothetical protein